MILMLRLREKLSCCVLAKQNASKKFNDYFFFWFKYFTVLPRCHPGNKIQKRSCWHRQTSVQILRILFDKNTKTPTLHYLTSHKSYLVTNTQLNRAKEDQTTPITCFSSKYAPFIKSWIGSSKSFQR